MEKYFSIFNSDQKSRDGFSFSISALEDGIWQASIYGVPSNLSHDIHRPVGWAHSQGLYFDADKVLTVGNMRIATEKQDMEILNNARKNFFNNYINKNIDKHAHSFIDKLGSLFNKEIGNWFYNSIVLYGYEDIVLKAFPELDEEIEKDKNGLVNVDFLLSEYEYLSQGVFRKKNSDLCILAHPFFRKSQSIYNNYHWIFLDELISHNDNKDVNIKLKLDLNYLGYFPSFITALEFEYWWGPRYNDDIESIKPDLTQYGSNEFEKLYYNIDRTEFFWKADKKQHTFELEEVKDELAPTLTDTYACRYVHSIYNKEMSSFEHFDGAIRGYTTELMIERLDKKMTEMGRNSEYTKLFRVDGNLDLSIWKSLVTNYMQGNPQIYEYFGLEQPSIKQVANEEEKTALEKYVPYSINKGDGVRLYVSYHPKSEAIENKRSIPICDILTLEDGTHNALEYMIVELKKCYNKIGAELELPEDCILLMPEDYYSNIPCILHSDDDTQELINESVEAIKLLVNKLSEDDGEEILSFSISWNIEDKEVCISFLGHASDISHWLNSFERIPVERSGLKLWLESQQKFTQANSNINCCPVLSKIIYDDGKLFLKRRLVQKDANISFPDKQNPMVYQVNCDDGKDDLAHSLQNNKLYMAPCMIVEKSKCKKSGMDYKDSPLSILFDETSQIMDSIKLASFHWTDKPRPIEFM